MRDICVTTESGTYSVRVRRIVKEEQDTDPCAYDVYCVDSATPVNVGGIWFNSRAQFVMFADTVNDFIEKYKLREPLQPTPDNEQ